MSIRLGGESSQALDGGSTRLISNLGVRILISVIGFGLLALFLYAYGLHSNWGNADLVRGLLQGSDMARGNVMLDHWYSGSDSYWTIDLVFFAVGILLIGAKVILLHIIAALVWAALIATAVYVGTMGLRNSPKIVATVTVLVILGLPCPRLAGYLSSSMVHVATALYTLIAFVALRKGRFGWGWLVAVALFCVCALGDPLVIAYGLVPAFCVGALDGVRGRDWRRAIPTSSAPVVASVLAVALRLLANHLGTYRIAGSTKLVLFTQMIVNLRRIVPDGISLLGLGHSLTSSGVPWELELVRSFGVVAVLAGFLGGTGCLLLGVVSGRPRIDVQGMEGRTDESFRLNDLLVLGILGDAATYVALRFDATATRYLVVGVIFSSILAAMLIGQCQVLVRSKTVRRAVATVGIVIVGGYTICASVTFAQPVAASPYVQLGQFLESHHLYRGVGDYWTSAPISVYSNDRVTVRQVTTSNGTLWPYLVLSKSGWYIGRFQFLVYDLDESAYGMKQLYGQEIQQASNFPFAPVAHIFRDGPFRIVVWKSPQSMVSLQNG